MGGDEFFILFRDIPFHALEKKLQVIRSRVERVVLSDYPELRFSISIGGVYGPGRTLDLMEDADKLLYQAKREQSGLKIDFFHETKESAGRQR